MDRRDFLSGGASGLVGLYPALRSAPGEYKVRNVEVLQTVDPADHSLVYVQGRSEPDDGGEGLFVWSSERDPSKIDGGTGRGENAVYVGSSRTREGHWFRATGQSHMNVQWFGAKGDGTTSDTRAIQDALWTSGASGVQHTFFPPGTYRITNPIRIADYGSGHVIEGSGILSTKLVKEGPAVTPLRDNPEADIDACIVLDQFSTEGHLVDFYGTQIRALSLQGSNQDEPEGPFSRSYGLYVRDANRVTVERVQFSYFRTAFFARSLWMSSLEHLKAEKVRQFIAVGATEAMLEAGTAEEDEESGPRTVPASTSLQIRNCYCSQNITGTAFLLHKVYYSSLSNCGADNVRGWPYHIKRCRGITIESVGFEWSRNGRGVWFEGSKGVVFGLQSFNSRPSSATDELTSQIQVTADRFGRASQLIVQGSYLGDFVDQDNQWLRKEEVQGEANPNVVLTGHSRLLLLDTRVPRNGSDHPRWTGDDDSHLLVIGGNLGGDSIWVRGAGGAVDDEKRGTSVRKQGLYVGAEKVVGGRQEAVGRLDQEADDAYNPDQLQAVSDKVDAIIDLLAASTGHGLTND